MRFDVTVDELDAAALKAKIVEQFPELYRKGIGLALDLMYLRGKADAQSETYEILKGEIGRVNGIVIDTEEDVGRAQ